LFHAGGRTYIMNLIAAAFRKFAKAPKTTGFDFSTPKDGREYEDIKQQLRKVGRFHPFYRSRRPLGRVEV
jgi:hypothetical protein